MSIHPFIHSFVRCFAAELQKKKRWIILNKENRDCMLIATSLSLRTDDLEQVDDLRVVRVAAHRLGCPSGAIEERDWH